MIRVTFFNNNKKRLVLRNDLLNTVDGRPRTTKRKYSEVDKVCVSMCCLCEQFVGVVLFCALHVICNINH